MFEGWLITVRDVAEREARKRFENLGSTAAGVAHDLNNALSPILMGTQLLRGPLSPQTIDSVIELIESAAERGSAIVKQVLTCAGGVPANRTRVDVKGLVAEAVQIASKAYPPTVQIVSRCAEDLASVEGDAPQLHQLIVCLCLSARDAVPPGGIVTVEVENAIVNDGRDAHWCNAHPGRHV
jgi:signal transduction histidine kinase